MPLAAKLFKYLKGYFYHLLRVPVTETELLPPTSQQGDSAESGVVLNAPLLVGFSTWQSASSVFLTHKKSLSE